MNPEAPRSTKLNRVGDVNVVSFESPYLQAEDEITKVGVELAELAQLPAPAKVLLSFHGVRFVSSSMLAQLVKLHNQLSKVKGRLRVCSLTPAVREVVHASLRGAVRRLAGHRPAAQA